MRFTLSVVHKLAQHMPLGYAHREFYFCKETTFIGCSIIKDITGF